jgi:ppGpp synthetase/RelA/SpoT-type nucleotidyltranferase
MGKMDSVADRKASILYDYGRLRPIYASLVEEVMFVVRQALDARGIKVANLLGRVKEVASLSEKIERKKYTNVAEVSDLAGVRIVCMYSSQTDEVAALIRNEFDVLEALDKSEELGADRMGYQGIHFLVKLGSSYSGPRYGPLRGLRCEVQVRTVLQDAWALISHHLVYKNEDAVPVRLRRDLNNVTSLLEIAQSVFDSVEEKRDLYLLEIKESLKAPADFLLQPIDYDTLTAYSHWRFPHLKHSEFWQTRLLEDLNPQRYARLRDLDGVVERAKDAVTRYREDMPNWFQFSTDFLTKSLGFVDPEFREKHDFGPPTREAFEKYKYLVKDLEGEAA